MKKIFFLLFVISLSPFVHPQIATSWKNYSDMKNVRSIQASGTTIWAATDGGGFSYDLTTNSYNTYNKADGLNGIFLSSVAIDNYGKIWFGSNNGILDVYNPAENTFKTILGIFNSSDKSSKQINDLSVSGDTIIISSDFGISLVDSKNYFFYDTFFKFGDFLSNTKVNSALKSNLIYSATGLGLAIQKPEAQNLSAPESWNVYNTANGLPSNNVLKIVNFGDMIIAATNRGMAVFDGTFFSTFLPQFSNNYITDITSWENTLFFITDSSTVYSYDGGEPSLRYSSPDRSLTKVIYSPVFGILVSSIKGIIQIESSPQEFLFPNGPQVNQFPMMSVDGSGNLWSASGTDVTGRGFYKFDGESWTNYNTSNTILPANSYFSVYAAPDNTVYVGSWGSGFVRIKDNVIENFNSENTGMQGIDDNPDFLLPSDFKIDSKNNLWVLNYGAVDRRNLSVLTPQRWYHFSVDLSHYVEENFYLAIDQYDTKWFACRNQGRTGLFYFNENNTLDNTADDRAGYITEANGLNTNSIYSVVTDRRGDVWIGTNLGVNIITNNQTIISSGTPQLRISSVFSLRQQTINAIAVDPLNQKWIGTNQGLILVNSDGTQLLATYNTKNSALLSDQITSIAIDGNSGIVYVGTEEGLTSFETPAINPKESFEELLIYPNPFFLDNSTQQIVIDGLIRDSELKVLTITGKLVKELEVNSPASPGGFRAFWDGRDESGELVSSGVYFIVAFDLEGNNVETGKIAIIRK